MHVKLSSINHNYKQLLAILEKPRHKTVYTTTLVGKMTITPMEHCGKNQENQESKANCVGILTGSPGDMRFIQVVYPMQLKCSVSSVIRFALLRLFHRPTFPLLGIANWDSYR